MSQHSQLFAKKKKWDFFKKKPVLLFVLAIFLIGVFFIATKPRQWWRYSPSEQITQPLLTHRNLLFVATNHGTVTALDRQTGKVKWEYQREKEIALSPKLQYGKLYIGYNDGVIASLDAFTGKELWIYQTPNNSLLQTDLILNQTKIFFADTSGTIRAISLRNGKDVWQLATPSPESVDKLLTKDGLIWFGALMIDRGTLYAVKTHGYAVAIHAESGKKQWEKTLDGTIISDPFVTRTSLIISTSKRAVNVITRKSGELKESEVAADEQDPVFCQSDYYPDGILRELAYKTNEKVPVHLFTQESEKGQQVIQLTKKGIVRGFNHNTLQQEWILSLPFSPTKCFFDQDQSLYASSSDGEMVKVGLKTQTVLWQKKKENELLFINSIRKTQSFRQDNKRVQYHTEYLFISDNKGRVSRLNPDNGETRWTLQTDGEVYVPPALAGNNLLIVSTNGGLYRLSPHSGQPGTFNLFSPSITWSANTKDVQKGQIFELSFNTPSELYMNSYTEANITAEFKSEDGESFTIDGFFYDRNTWKVRFNPSSVGKWSWQAVWKDVYQEKKFNGTFQNSREYSPLHSSSENPRWLTRDDKTIATFVGLNDCIADWNRNGYPLDDFYLRDGGMKTATISGSVPQTFTFNTSVIHLESYLKNYKPGFNLFRQSVENCSPSLYDTSHFTYSKYLTREGKIHDELSQSLFKEGYTVWFTLFGFSVPFGGGLVYPDQKIAMENYIRYAVSRYGAYVDVWEIGNEAVVSEEYTKHVVELIHKYDPYERLVSVSWEKPQLKEITLTAPHWYDSEKDSDSDVATIAQIEKFNEYQKPIIFGEQGNKTRNWDKTSAQRMRVRIWTAFFHQSFLSFWNQTNDKNFYNPTFQNSNIYLAEEEIGYAEIFHTLTSGLPISLKPAESSVPPSEIRSYKLQDDSLSLEYFFNSAVVNEKATTVSVPNTSFDSAIAEWIDLKTGDVLKKEELNAQQSTSSPPFTADILLRIKKK